MGRNPLFAKCTEADKRLLDTRRFLFKTLSTFSEEVYNTRVDAHVDNPNLSHFGNNEGGKSIPLPNNIKEVFQLTLDVNISLNMFQVASKDNNAYSPSRHTFDLDCSLFESSWKLVESSFGPHSFDLMAIPSNVRKTRDGHNLKFFSLFPCKGSSSVTIFSQTILLDENYCLLAIHSNWPSDRIS